MKKHSGLILTLSILVVLTGLGDLWVSAKTIIPLSNSDIPIRVLTSSDHELRVLYEFSEIEAAEITTERGLMTEIGIPGLSHSIRIGDPKLPVSRRIIAVPVGAEVTVRDLDFSRTELFLDDQELHNPLIPAQPSLSKSMSPEDVPFAYNASAYITPGYDQHPVASVEELGMLRGLRLILLIVEPVKYDPMNNSIAVYNDIEVSVAFSGGSRTATKELREQAWSPYFESEFRRFVLNYEEPDLLRDLISYPVKYVIISDPMFEDQLQPFIQWKTMKGFEVITGYTDDPNIGSTRDSIKTWLQELYDAGTPEDPAPSFVLFVGDVQQIPAWNGTTGGHVTDLHYVRLAGTDYMPDMYFGRFSATSPEQLQPQIDKTLEYERFEMPDPGFLGEAVMISGVDAGHAGTWGNGQINYGTTYYFNEDHGIFSHTYLYPESGSSSASIINDVSNGAGYANYTAHGYEQGWGNPSFTNADIQNLNNSGMYPTVVGNCCLTNAFDSPTCFGEAWLRAENKGAIGYIGATNSSYWNEDFWWGVGAGTISPNPTFEATGPGAYDGMFHDHGEPFPEWYTTQYAFNMAGCLAVIEGGSWSINYYWEIYSLMGDPSLSTYFGVPGINTVYFPDQIMIGETQMNVSAEPWSYVALSHDGTLAGAALVDETGQATLHFQTFVNLGEADIVITRQNRQPVIDTIEIVQGQGPVVVVTETAIEDSLNGNGNGIAEFGELLNVSITETNFGSEMAYNVSAVITTDDPYLTITDAMELYGDIPVGEAVTIENGFQVEISADVPDNHPFSISIITYDGAENEWVTEFTFYGFAPIVGITSTTVNDSTGDGDGSLDAGELAIVTVELQNHGGAMLENVLSVLSSTDPYVTIASDSSAVPFLMPGQSAEFSFDVMIDETTPSGYFIDFVVDISGDNYAVVDSFTLGVGLFTEGFESGDFGSFPWVMDGNSPWTITTSNTFDGVYSAKSGQIGNMQTSEMSVNLTTSTDGAISFRYKVSSEDGYDYLRFYIDGIRQNQWSGEVDWTEVSYPVSSGNHTFAWSYRKDQNTVEGSDCGWIDAIVFPPLTQGEFPNIEVFPASFEVSVDEGQVFTDYLTISNSGRADLSYQLSVSTRSLTDSRNPAVKLDKGERDGRRGEPVSKGSGGPDGFGYTWIDSDEVDGPEYDWIDISADGFIPGADDDSTYCPADIGFPFTFYGIVYTSVQICTNGWLSFTSASDEWTNQEIPNREEPNTLIAPFWDDLNPESGGNIYYLSDPDNDRFIVQWDQVPHYDDPPDTGTYSFQVILFSDGRIVYQYQHLEGAINSCTVGIENETGSDGLQVVFNEEYLHDELAVLIESSDQWLTVLADSGMVSPDSSDVVAVHFDATNLSSGQYIAAIQVASNDPVESIIDIPVTLNVEQLGADRGQTLPIRFTLQISPNPFNTSCRFAARSPGMHLDDLRVYDIKGNLVWRGSDSSGQAIDVLTWKPSPLVGSGVYVVRAQSGEQKATKKIVYLK